MTTNPKPLLTRIEVDQERKALAELDSKFGGAKFNGAMDVDCFIHKQSSMLNTIEAMAELLTERCEDLVGFEEWCGTHDKFCEPCQRKHDLLSTFNATGGEGP